MRIKLLHPLHTSLHVEQLLLREKPWAKGVRSRRTKRRCIWSCAMLPGWGDPATHVCWVWVGGGAGAPAGGRGEGAVQIVVVTLTHNQLTTLPHLRARDCVFTYAKVCSIVSMDYITYMQYSKLYTRIHNTHTYIHSHMTELHSCTQILFSEVKMSSYSDHVFEVDNYQRVCLRGSFYSVGRHY